VSSKQFNGSLSQLPLTLRAPMDPAKPKTETKGRPSIQFIVHHVLPTSTAAISSRSATSSSSSSSATDKGIGGESDSHLGHRATKDPRTLFWYTSATKGMVVARPGVATVAVHPWQPAAKLWDVQGIVDHEGGRVWWFHFLSQSPRCSITRQTFGGELVIPPPTTAFRTSKTSSKIAFESFSNTAVYRIPELRAQAWTAPSTFRHATRSSPALKAPWSAQSRDIRGWYRHHSESLPSIEDLRIHRATPILVRSGLSVHAIIGARHHRILLPSLSVKTRQLRKWDDPIAAWPYTQADGAILICRSLGHESAQTEIDRHRMLSTASSESLMRHMGGTTGLVRLILDYLCPLDYRRDMGACMYAVGQAMNPSHLNPLVGRRWIPMVLQPISRLWSPTEHKLPDPIACHARAAAGVVGNRLYLFLSPRENTRRSVVVYGMDTGHCRVLPDSWHEKMSTLVMTTCVYDAHRHCFYLMGRSPTSAVFVRTFDIDAESWVTAEEATLGDASLPHWPWSELDRTVTLHCTSLPCRWDCFVYY
jgi:hypothetical protein